jgi:hypothetical protein
MTSLEIFLTILTVATGLCAIIFGYLAFRRNQKKDDTDEGSLRGTMLTDIGYIKSGVDDIKDEQREQRKTNADFLERLVDCEASAKQAHKRIDGLENRLNHQ